MEEQRRGLGEMKKSLGLKEKRIAELDNIIKRLYEDNITSFLKAVKKYTGFEELTPGMLRNLIEKTVVHAPEKSSGHRQQKVDIYYTFVGELTTSHEVVERKRKAA